VHKKLRPKMNKSSTGAKAKRMTLPETSVLGMIRGAMIDQCRQTMDEKKTGGSHRDADVNVAFAFWQASRNASQFRKHLSNNVWKRLSKLPRAR